MAALYAVKGWDANYLRFFEEARTAYLESFGLSMKKLSDEGILFAVRKQEVECRVPVRYGEILKIKTSVKEITPYRMKFCYEVENSEGKKNHFGNN